MNPLPTPQPENADAFFERQLGTSLTAVLLPVPGENPAGVSLRGGDTWAAIGAARHADDPTLPLGAWQYELARADWPQASALALDALQHKSKDLQLVAWFFEAQINLNGFAAISPCMVLLQSLCEQFWDKLYPPPDDDGDLSHRANLIRWMGEKLLPVLRQVPLIGIGREREFGWADWEQAHRNQKAQGGNKNTKPVEGVTLAELNFAISATATDAFAALAATLGQAIATIEVLNHSMDRLFGEQAPGLAGMSNLLQQIHSFLGAELHKRGVRQIATPELTTAAAPAAVAAPTLAPAAPPAGERPMAEQPVAAGGPPCSRADAYARLAETAEFLMRLEPHSPVPYLVRRATEWGSLNTVELYEELFLRLGGQLNIFEMLGLEVAASGGK